MVVSRAPALGWVVCTGPILTLVTVVDSASPYAKDRSVHSERDASENSA